MLLEIIAFNIESCKIIEAAGAHRVELCDNAGEGGTTPSFGFIKAARSAVSISLFPIIRPRGGDFYYSNDEFEMMKTDIAVCKKLGCDGVVFGLLNTDGTVDKKRTAKLVQLAYPMSVTFHRAFDRVNDMASALEDVIDCGCERILTSGLYPVAEEGLKNLAVLVKLAAGRIIIMPGSGLRYGNIKKVAEATGATEFHSSARITIPTKMEYNNGAMKEKPDQIMVDAQEVKMMLRQLNSITQHEPA
ncbi:MAG: copper homeostasis protein CutC [Ferruginibacter sp.]